MNEVVIIGADHHNTLGVVESFGEKNINPNVILHTQYNEGYVSHSKFIKRCWCCKDERAIINCLLSNFKNSDEKCVVIATNDLVASIIDKYVTELKPYFYLPTINPMGSLLDWMGKEKMSIEAKKIGLDVPKTWIVTNAKIPSDIEYPVITKAISSVAGSKDNIKICKQESELKDFLNNQSHCPTIQIQKFIEKEFEFQFLGCSLNEGEEVIIAGRTHIDRPNGLDNTFFLKFDKCEDELKDVESKSIEFVRKTKYTGPFSIEFLRDKNDGKNYFTEMNFRNDGNAICVTASGMNIPYILYLCFIGADYKSEIKKSHIRPIYLCPDVYYFTRFLCGEISLKEWITNMRKTNCFTTFFKKDPKPFFWFLWLAIKKRIIRISN